MELRVESTDGAMPVGSYVGVRVGDVLKQGRYDHNRCYHFPQVDRRRNAKIDIYKHVGSCVIAVDPEAKSIHEVVVASSDNSVGDLKLKVSTTSTNADAGKLKDARTKQVKNQAKDYLNRYNIEEKLSEAVKALLKDQPANPTDFLCRHLMAVDGMTSPVPSPTAYKAPVMKVGPPAGKPTGQLPMKPFSSYYKGNILPAATINYSKFKPLPKPPPQATAKPPAAAAAGGKSEQDVLREQARAVLVKASGDGKLKDALTELGPDMTALRSKARQCLQQSAKDGVLEKALTGQMTKGNFSLKPSVGTWCVTKPAPVKKAPEDTPFCRKPSVGTWLAPSPVMEKDPGPGNGKMVITSQSLMGSQFHSMGMPNSLKFV